MILAFRSLLVPAVELRISAGTLTHKYMKRTGLKLRIIVRSIETGLGEIVDDLNRFVELCVAYHGCLSDE
jgi:hypothetical protein